MAGQHTSHNDTDTRTSTHQNKEESIEGLTKRQIEVLSLLTQGMSNKEIARTLYIEPSTVKSHIGRILAALGKNTRTEVAVLWTETLYKAVLAADDERRRTKDEGS